MCAASATAISNGSYCLNTQELFDQLRLIVSEAGGFYQSPGLYALGWERYDGPESPPPRTRAIVQQAHDELFLGYAAVPSGADCRPKPAQANAVAAFVDAAGVRLTSPFVTRFGTGEGDRFAVNGSVAYAAAWNGVGLQDVQPTYLCAQGAGQTAAIDYSTAWDGGSALNVTGAGLVALYETSLATPATPISVVRYQGTTTPLLTVHDGTGWHTAVQQSSTTDTHGWTTSVQALSGLGATVTGIGVTTGTGTTVVGELGLMGAADYRPANPPPTQLVTPLDGGDTTWPQPAGTWYSNVYGCTDSAAAPVLLGRSFQPAFDLTHTLQTAPATYNWLVAQPVAASGISQQAVRCRAIPDPPTPTPSPSPTPTSPTATAPPTTQSPSASPTPSPSVTVVSPRAGAPVSAGGWFAVTATVTGLPAGVEVTAYVTVDGIAVASTPVTGGTTGTATAGTATGTARFERVPARAGTYRVRLGPAPATVQSTPWQMDVRPFGIVAAAPDVGGGRVTFTVAPGNWSPGTPVMLTRDGRATAVATVARKGTPVRITVGRVAGTYQVRVASTQGPVYGQRVWPLD